ncbi:AP-3 complex subunit mu-1 [Rhodotorula toruloides]|uniref:BY PROTMAP: gi/472588397/gb/EMS25869.1/ AP-3 complex subunit mu-1 [Rhodosporidium toruloides NP11] gi/647396189/emb/CDR38212.1/ RHTO0S03e05930g1_1 [Rhodosporidium toruloides] n=1 Tax=Rhodotorula toruloides TaxID=5286 RepID=A0A0K3C810_RHOTO|nr:AP-3 complex subunit mu-1 [Rhodotorula toruloides]PRQ78000.1 Mu homology domain-containing protein [Rhodotorula toruloides]
MQGVAIVDSAGRRIPSTHFPSSLQANLAIDAAVASSSPVLWVPGVAGKSEDDVDEESGDEEDEVEQPWAHASRRSGGGVAVCQVQRNGLRFVSLVDKDVDPLIPLTFLTELYEVLKTYIAGPVTEGSIKDNFDVVLALLQEMVVGGRPQLSQSSQLKDLVVPPDSQLLAKVALNAATAAGLAIPSQSTAANALIASPLPWRRQGIKYTSNEIYFDLIETLSFTLDPAGKPITGSINGDISCRSRLSGMPDLSLNFTDPSVLDESAAFHSCVRYSRWMKDKVVSFVPPDGTFPLLSFVHTPPKTSPALALALLPFSLTSQITLGTSGGSFSITLTSRSPPSRPLTNLVIRLPLATGANGVTATVSGGAYLRDDEGRSIGGGAGRWDVVAETQFASDGKATEKQFLVWKIDQLESTDRPAVLTGQYYASPNARKPPAFTFTFDSPSSGFSGLRINSLKLLNEPYSVYKGVKTRGRGEIEVRTG